MQIGYIRSEQDLPSIEEQRQALGTAGFDLADPHVSIYAHGERDLAIASMKRGDTLVLAAAACLGNSLFDIADALIEIGQRGGSVLDLKSGTMISPSGDRAQALEYARNTKLSNWSKVDASLRGKRGRAIYHWTSEKVAKLKTMSAAGETEEAMAEALGCSRAAIRKELGALGLGPVGESRHRRPWLEWTDENVAKLKEMRAAGKSQNAIARELGCAQTTLSLKMSELGLSTQGKHVIEWSPERVANLKSMVAAGVPVPMIAADLGVSRATAYNKIKELGLKTVGSAKYDWTPAKIAKLKSMVEEGETITKITKEIGSSVSTAVGKMDELGLKTRGQEGYREHAYDWTPEKLAKLKEMVEARETQAAMADEFGLHWVTIAKKLRALKLKSKGQRRGYDWTPDKVAKLEEMVAAEVSQVAMAKELNCSVATIRHQLVSLGRTPDGKHAAHWSPVDIEKLKSMAAAGETRAAMAAALRRSRPAISYKLDALGLTSTVKSSGSAPKSSGGAPGGRREFKWTPAKDAKLKSMVIAGESQEAMAEAFGCTIPALQNYLREILLGPARKPRSKRFKWTAANIAKLKEMSEAGGSQAAMAKALHCGTRAVSSKLAELGLSSRGSYVVAWPPEKVAKLKSMISAGESLVEISAELGASVPTIQKKMKEIGLKPAGHKGYDWTPGKVDSLKSMVAAGDTVATIADEIGCSRSTLLKKLADLGLKTRGRKYEWTPASVSKLKEMAAAGHGQKAMAAELGVDDTTIYRKLKSLGLKSKGKLGARGYQWTPEEIAILKEMVAAGGTHREIGDAIGCGPGAVQHKMKTLGLKPKGRLGRHGFDWTPEKEAKLRGMVEAGKTQKAMASEFDLNIASVNKKLKSLGLKSKGKLGRYAFDWTPEKDAKLKAMFVAGQTQKVMMDEIGCSGVTLRKRLDTLGLVWFEWTQEKTARLEEMLAADEIPLAIMTELRCSHQELEAKMAELGYIRRRVVWTPRKIAQLRSMRKRGATITAMAAAHGCNNVTIRKKLNEIGLE